MKGPDSRYNEWEAAWEAEQLYSGFIHFPSWRRFKYKIPIEGNKANLVGGAWCQPRKLSGIIRQRSSLRLVTPRRASWWCIALTERKFVSSKRLNLQTFKPSKAMMDIHTVEVDTDLVILLCKCVSRPTPQSRSTWLKRSICQFLALSWIRKPLL